MMQRIIAYCFFIICVSSVFAQDIHFSNFYTNTLNLNPADAGFFSGKTRFCLAYRDQYRTVANPYQTISAHFDGKIEKRNRNYLFGYGAIINFDMAGDADYNTFQFGIPFAQHIQLSKNTLIVSYGILPAIYCNTIDYTNLSFSEQFNGINYDPDIQVSESLDMNSATYFDLSAGLQVSYKPTKTQTYTVGVACYNLNQPSISFFDDDDANLQRRYLVHASAVISVTSNIDLIPGYKMQFQRKQHEFHFGGMGIFYFDGQAFSQIQTGVWFRSKNKDAVIFGLGCRYQGFDIMLDYDLNISSLKTASNGHGAVEATVSYIVENKHKSKRMAAVRCPHHL